jgi:hypothetical protein
VSDKKTWTQLRKATTLVKEARPTAASILDVPAEEHGAGESSGLGWPLTAALVVGGGAVAVYAARRHFK